MSYVATVEADLESVNRRIEQLEKLVRWHGRWAREGHRRAAWQLERASFELDTLRVIAQMLAEQLDAAREVVPF